MDQISPSMPRMCKDCLFFAPSDNFISETGICHRYPRAELVRDIYWCGEFTPTSRLETK